MKRFLICLVLSVIFITPMHSQIQDRFFGFKLGNDVFPLLQYIEEHYEGMFIGPYSHSFPIGEYAGINWNKVEIEYPNCLFSNITFIKSFEDRRLAFYFFSNLKRRLNKKYIKHRMENYTQKVLYDDGKTACLLTCDYDEAPSGDMFWFLRLFYWDKTLSKNPIEKQDEDL